MKRCLAMVLFLALSPQVSLAGGSDAEIEALVRRSLMSWETGVEEDFTATAHPELVFAFPGARTDAEGALRVFRFWKENFRDTRVYVHRILVDGDRFSAEYQFATTHKASGRRTVAGTVAVGEVRDGRIVLLKEYVDGRVSRLQEEGKLPLDEGQEPFPWPPTGDGLFPWERP
jgi:ketosteroid isomerase-like protein